MIMCHECKNIDSQKYSKRLLFLFFFFLLLLLLLPNLTHYSPFCTLPSNKTFLNSRRSLATDCQFLIPTIYKRSSASSVHLLRDLPLFLVPLWLLQYALAFVGLHSFTMTIPYQSPIIYKIVQYPPLVVSPYLLVYSYSLTFSVCYGSI